VKGVLPEQEHQYTIKWKKVLLVGINSGPQGKSKSTTKERNLLKEKKNEGRTKTLSAYEEVA